jgi:uncharacterized protein (TIGR02246 family)
VEEHELKQIIAQADDAINREDFDAVMSFYADDATLVVMPGKQVTGRDALRKAFLAIAEYFNHTLHVSQGAMVVVEGADTALVLAKTHVRAIMSTGEIYDIERRGYVRLQKSGIGQMALCRRKFLRHRPAPVAASPVNIEFHWKCALRIANPLPLPASVAFGFLLLVQCAERRTRCVEIYSARA